MSEFKFQGHAFKMENSAKEFLEKYVSRIKKYAKSHNISDDLVDDIDQSILEKLFEVKWEITQKKLISIVNSIWEPEDIFENESSYEINQNSDTDSSHQKPYERWQKTNWTRPQDSAILLWVCAMFWQSTKIPTWIWRLLVIFVSRVLLALGFGSLFLIWCVAYLTLAVIFPIKNKDYKHCSMLKYRWIQICDLWLCIPNFFNWVFHRLGGTLIRRCKQIMKTVAPFFGSLWWVIKRLFLLFISLCLLAGVVGLGVLLYYLVFGFVKGNIDYTAILPAITKWWVLLWLISAFIFLITAIWWLFKKKLSNNATIITAVWCWILALVIAIVSWISFYSTLESYNSEIWEKKQIEIDVENKDNPIYIELNHIPYDRAYLTENRFVSIFPSDNDKIRVEYSFILKWKWENLIKAVENLSDIEYKRDHEILIIGLNNSEIFSTITPFVPVSANIDIYLPKDVEAHIVNSSIHLINVELPEWSDANSINPRYCLSLTYNPNTDRIFCNKKISSRSRYNISLQNLQERSDSIVPLKWSNSAWKLGSNADQYRLLDSINVRNDHSLLAKYSDRFFNFFIEIEYSIDDRTWIFTLKSSKVVDIEQKWLMNPERIKQYGGRDQLKDYPIQIEEDKADEIAELNQKVKELQDKVDSLINSTT